MNARGSKARDAILTALRRGLSKSQHLFRNQQERNPIPHVPSAVAAADGHGLVLARMFGDNLRAALGTYEIVENATTVSTAIVTLIEKWRQDNGGPDEYGSELLSWAGSELPIPDLSHQLELCGVSLFAPTDVHDGEQRARAAALSVGLTGVDAAFAGTGSMVLVPGPGKSRAAGILPLHHIALTPVSKIFPNFESWLARLRSEGDIERFFRDHAQLAFVTGPSKSADIELNLTLGVHGPRDVHAIIFDDSGT